MSNTLSRLATDPLKNFKFLVQISHKVAEVGGQAHDIDLNLGFTSVSGFSATTNAIPYRQGGYNTVPQMIPGQTSFTPISCTRGVLLGKRQDYNWFRELFAVTTGQGSNTYQANQSHGGFRGTVKVYVLPHPRTDVLPDDLIASASGVFKVYNAWPTSLSYSDLNAGDNALLVSSMTLAHEGWTFDLADPEGANPTNPS